MKEIIVENIGDQWIGAGVAQGHAERINVYFAGEDSNYSSTAAWPGETATITLTSAALDDADRVNVTLADDLEFITGVEVDGPRGGTLTLTLTLSRAGLEIVRDLYHHREGLFNMVVYESEPS